MKRTKLKQRISQAVSAFWADDQENYGDNNSLSLANESGLLKPDSAVSLAKNGDVLVKMLKQIFIFLPGAFYLFFGTLSICSFEFFWNKPWSILAVFLIGSLMTIFGIGNIKNPKHLAIPLSIVAVGITAFSLFSMLGGLKYVFEYGIYFFPIALIVSVLVRNWTDNSQDL